jgi:hypothetical protein
LDFFEHLLIWFDSYKLDVRGKVKEFDEPVKGMTDA